MASLRLPVPKRLCPPKTRSSAELKTLILSIETGDVATCPQLDRMSLKELNRLEKFQHARYKQVLITPLTAAVWLQRTEIVRLLLERGVNTDKIGRYTSDQCVVYHISPLLQAIWNADVQVIRMILEKGADVQQDIQGPRQMEEEGALLRFRSNTSPLNEAIQKSMEIFQLVFDKADMRKDEYYGLTARHRCLCFAVDDYIKRYPDEADASFIQHIIQSGGRICTESPEYSGHCDFLLELFLETYEHCIVRVLATPDQCCVKCYRCSLIKVWELLLCLDYNNEFSPIHSFLKSNSEEISTTIRDCESKVFQKFCCDNSRVFFHRVEDMINNVSTLKEVCRYVIRQTMVEVQPRIQPDMFTQLRIPSDLHDYVSIKLDSP